MRLKILISCLIVLSLLPGCGGGGGIPPSQDNNPPTPPFNIYGVVTDSLGRVLGGASVSAYYKDAPQTILDQDETDAKGRYYLWVPVAEDKKYVVTASKTGYQSASKEVELSPPDYQQEVNFSLEPKAKR